jgi:hypothetical protein
MRELAGCGSASRGMAGLTMRGLLSVVRVTATLSAVAAIIFETVSNPDGPLMEWNNRG